MGYSSGLHQEPLETGSLFEHPVSHDPPCPATRRLYAERETGVMCNFKLQGPKAAETCV